MQVVIDSSWNFISGPQWKPWLWVAPTVFCGPRNFEPSRRICLFHGISQNLRHEQHLVRSLAWWCKYC